MKRSLKPDLVTENDVTRSFSEKDVVRFMSYVEILPYNHPTLRTPCWIWVGAKSRGKGNKKWYGSFRTSSAGSFAGRVLRAHRFSHEVLGGGTCPPDCHRDHRCNVSLCVNPHHIEVVSPEVNQLRKMQAAGKTGLKALPDLVNENDVQLSLPLYKNQWPSQVAQENGL